MFRFGVGARAGYLASGSSQHEIEFWMGQGETQGATFILN